MSVIQKKVAIIIPHFQTLELIRICLRSIRKFTNYPHEVIVVDNHSRDDSIAYLQSLKWIKLIARGKETEGSGSLAHQAALDIGISQTNAPYVLSLHSDTIAKHPQWLNRLVDFIEEGEKIGAVGTWKLEVKSPIEILLQRLTDVKRVRNWLTGHPLEERKFIRTHCALYRLDILSRLNLHFLNNDTAGKNIHNALINNGYTARFIPVEEMMCLVDHLNHGTFVLQKPITIKDWKHYRMHRKIKNYLGLPCIKDILWDGSLDQ